MDARRFRLPIAGLAALIGMLGSTAVPGATVHGVITDSLGSPVATTVSAYLGAEHLETRMPGGPTLRPRKPVTAQSDAVGKYALKDLVPGTYFVMTGRDSNFRPVTVSAGQDVTFDLRVPAPPALSIRVLDADRRPLAGIPVYVLKTAYQPGMLLRVANTPERTGQDGSVTISTRIETGTKLTILARGAKTRKEEPNKREYLFSLRARCSVKRKACSLPQRRAVLAL